MFGAHMTEIEGVLGNMVKEYPWAYAIVLLLVSKFVNSQSCGAGGDCSGRTGNWG